MVRINVLIKKQSLPACAAGTRHVHCMQEIAKGREQPPHSAHDAKMSLPARAPALGTSAILGCCLRVFPQVQNCCDQHHD